MSQPTEWCVIVYDKPGADRSAVRADHLKGIPPTVDSGIVKAAGAIYQDEARTKFAGSTFHLLANNKADIIEFLKKDVYYRKGIWDIDNVLAYPLGIAARTPKVLPGAKLDLFKI